ncbi:tetratricopeptide repeat protein [Leptolinea tardivitalis]|uniref:Bacterial transcriptional activator domain-containing protein n=1 Tax=Leptolinea tardivitalis TaxID=229920 RepID=A0A0P6XRS2_9CHLR|nr:hypothetical protein [Leptolinea tardivitalis]KPL75147.1 hypothetical protein ADM99_00600 [Leptolinea tardivitalis]GAP20366.1 hypothetical protein LTAR_00554 [Leptolinea tardivitalis]
MKELDVMLMFKEEFYNECSSPMLLIPFNSIELMQFTQNKEIPMSVIADNLQQMVDEHPEKFGLYKRLIIHTCKIAGIESYKQKKFFVSNQYFLSAAAIDPENVEVRKYLARSFHLIKKYHEAIDSYMFVIKNGGSDIPTWVYFIECLYIIGEVNHAQGLTQSLLKNVKRDGVGAKLMFGVTATRLLAEDKAPEEVRNLFKPFFSPDE